jgi:hypothetical protein
MNTPNVFEQLKKDIIILGEDCGALSLSGNGNNVGISTAQKAFRAVERSLSQVYKQNKGLMKKGPKTRLRVAPTSGPKEPPKNQFEALLQDVIILGDDCGAAAAGNIAVKNTLRQQYKSIQKKVETMGVTLFGTPKRNNVREKFIDPLERE